MKIAVAQISCSLGDPEANLSKVRDFSRRAKETGAELIVFPEMTDTGYSMPVIQKHADHWNNWICSRSSRDRQSSFRSRSSAACPNAMVHHLQFASSCRRDGRHRCEISQDSSVRGRAGGRANLLCSGRYLRELCARRSAFWFQHLLRSSVSRNVPKTRHRAERRRFPYFFRLALSAGRTFSRARASARDRKSKLRHCIEPRRERRRLMVLWQLRDYRSARSGNRSCLGRSRRTNSGRLVPRACALGSPAGGIASSSPRGFIQMRK